MAADFDKIKNKRRGRVNKKRGDRAERIMLNTLRSMGLACVRRIETGWRVERVKGKIVGATPLAAVVGDIAAVIPPNGRSVLVEVKRREERLIWSDLEAHQHKALTEHCEAGGVSVIGWYNPDEAAAILMDYSKLIGRLCKGARGLQWEEAQEYTLKIPACI
jgi:Holliday junction resolvase